jgi:hypothetical protein
MKTARNAGIVKWIGRIRVLAGALARQNHSPLRSSIPIYLTINMVAHEASRGPAPPR